MIRLTVELVPGGDESKKSYISQVEIINTGIVDVNFASFYRYGYMGWFAQKDKPGVEKLHGVIFHNQKNHIYYLLRELADEIVKVIK